MLINNSGASHYSFNSVSTHASMINGKKQHTTEAVSVRNGKGMKTVVKRVGNKTSKSKKELSGEEIRNIMDRKFMPTLFTPCHIAADNQLQMNTFSRNSVSGKGHDHCDSILNSNTKTNKTRKALRKSKKSSKKHSK
jgi:hypothetical protein